MQQISIDDLKEGEPIWVKSIAGGTHKSAGDVNIDITQEGSTRRELVTVPKTFIPIKITDFAPAKNFILSTSFRRTIASGVLVIIDPKDASKEISTPEGRKELERLRQELFSGVNFQDGQDKTVSAIEAVSELTESDKVNVRVKDIIMRSDIDDEGKLNQLRADEPELTIPDLNFILGIVDDKSEINTWVKNIKEKKEAITESIGS